MRTPQLEKCLGQSARAAILRGAKGSQPDWEPVYKIIVKIAPGPETGNLADVIGAGARKMSVGFPGCE